MRSKLFLPLLGAMTIVLFSCQKDVIKKENNQQLISKVNNWLDSRKPVGKEKQSENVELLKNHLETSALRIESSSWDEKIVIIPVKEEFKTLKNIDKEAIPNLVLILDKMGNVRKGNIVLFYPQSGQSYSKVPDNTFYNILNTSHPEAIGKFKYLSVTGKRLHELQYQDGRLKGFGNFKDSTANQNGRINFCIDWYWVYTWYDENGTIWYQTQEYVGSTCEGENCEDPYNAMLCPMDGSSGGGTGDDTAEFEEERNCVGTYNNRWVWTIEQGSGGGYVKLDEKAYGKVFKRNSSNDKFTNYLYQNIKITGNTAGAQPTLNQHTPSGIGTNLVTVVSGGIYTYPDSTGFYWNNTAQIQLGMISWSCW